MFKKTEETCLATETRKKDREIVEGDQSDYSIFERCQNQEIGEKD